MQPSAWALQALSGLLGVGISALGTGLYLWGIRHGRTLPHRASWLVWSVIALVAAAAHWAEGGRWSLLVLVGQGAGTVVVFGVSLWHGAGGYPRSTAMTLGVAAVGIAGWVGLEDPVAASACAALADGAGLAALTPKVWRDPATETLATYALAALSGLLASIAVGSLEPDLLLFPVYFCLGNAAMALLIGWRRRVVGDTRPAVGGTPALDEVSVSAAR